MDHIRLIYGSFTVQFWIIYDSIMDHLRLNYGSITGQLWISSDSIMDHFRLNYGSTFDDARPQRLKAWLPVTPTKSSATHRQSHRRISVTQRVSHTGHQSKAPESQTQTAGVTHTGSYTDAFP